MVYDYLDKYAFKCEMYDKDTDTTVELMLNYFPFDNSCQVININTGKCLFRRLQVPYLIPEILRVGNIINIFSKLLLITDCGVATMKTFFNHYERTFAMIKPVSPRAHGKIFTFISKMGFRIVRMKNGILNKDFALELYKYMGGNKMVPYVIDYITSGEVIGLELEAPHAINKWKLVVGDKDPVIAAPGTLRQMYGENVIKNVVHGSHSKESAIEALEGFFGKVNGKPRIPLRATFKNCTCCVIKPHAVIDGNHGAIIEHIATSKDLSAMAMFSMNVTNAKEFLEVYKGVLSCYEAMCIQLAEGKCIALEVKCKDPSVNVVCEFRKLCGPRDPAVCRALYPDSIRALYGKTEVENAVHCTDLPEDGESEVQYFFKLIPNEAK